MKNYVTAGIGFSRLLRLASKNSISVHPRYLLRFLFLAQSGLWTELFSWIERRRYGKRIASEPVPDNPVFIIGHWRTGTTLLHQLLNLDPNLAAPTLFQVAEPDCFICSYYYYRPLFSALLGNIRPMDNVRIGMNEPQEDEYAIFRITDFSPLERLVFPDGPRYFVLDASIFLPLNEKERKEWEGQLCSFYRKLRFYHGKTIVSKNPFHSFRIKELVALFPNARFIHIVRHPYEVVPSTKNMWKIVLEQNRLNNKGAFPGTEEVAMGMDRLLKCVDKDKVIIPEGNYHEMKFEDLENDPVGQCKKIYTHFGMPWDESVSRNIQSFTEIIKTYRKNEFHLAEGEKEIISRHLGYYMQKFNYR